MSLKLNRVVVAVLAVGLAASCQKAPSTPSANPAPSSSAPTPTAEASASGASRQVPATSAPSTFFAVLDDRAVEESATGLRQAFGPAEAIAPTRNGVWVLRTTGSCHSVIQLFNPGAATKFEPSGGVSALAVSNDGRWMAYSRAGRKAGSPQIGGGCGADALVIRDLRTGAERVWPADRVGIASLSWSADSQHLVFETGQCCIRSSEVRELDVATAPVKVTKVPLIHVPGAPMTLFFHSPTFAGNQILLLADDVSAPAEQYRVITAAGKTVAVLQDEGVELDADQSGRHLLVSLYGDPNHNGSLLSITTGAPISVLGKGYSDAQW